MIQRVDLQWRATSWIGGVLMAAAACGGSGDGGSDASNLPIDATLADAAVTDAVVEVDAMPDAMPQLALTVEPAILEFDVTPPGGSSEAEVNLVNPGADEITVIGIEGFGPPFFPARDPPIRIPAGASRTLIVRFEPAEAGQYDADLSWVTFPPLAVPNTALRATAALPEPELVTAVVDFGVLEPGMADSATIDVRNGSEHVPLRITAVSMPAAPFSVVPGVLPIEIFPGETGALVAQFQPVAAGEFEAVVTLSTNGGSLEATLAGRAIAAGDIAVTGIEPAWGPVDEAVRVVVHGGEFAREPDAIHVGGVALEDVERIDVHRVAGTLTPSSAATGTLDDVVDVRVEIGGEFGVGTDLFVRTPARDAGRTLDAAALSGPIGPAGNPWHLAIDTVPGDAILEIAAGTVIVVDSGVLTFEGALRADGRDGPIVFSAAEPIPGAWSGLVLAAGVAEDDIQRIVVEYAGADGAAIRSERLTTLLGVTVRQSAGDGIRVSGDAGLFLVGGTFTDLRDGVVLTDADVPLLELDETRARRTRWPVRGHFGHFSSVIGAMHDWRDNAHDAAGLVGPVTEVTTVSNQPVTVVIALAEPLTVAAEGSLRISALSRFELTAPIVVEGAFVLPAGLTLPTGEDTAIDIAAGGRLVLEGEVEIPVRLGDAADDAPRWNGLRIASGATVEGGHVYVQHTAEAGPAVDIATAIEAWPGLVISDAPGVGLRIAAEGVHLADLVVSAAGAGVRFEGGSGSLDGVVDGSPPAEFQPAESCGDWDLSGLTDADGAPIECP